MKLLTNATLIGSLVLITACSNQQIPTSTGSQQISSTQQIKTTDGDCHQSHEHMKNQLTNVTSHCHPNITGVHMYEGAPMDSYQ